MAKTMACDRAAFKAYDVRGTYPDQLDEAGAYAIGRAYVEFLGATTLAVGRDMRTMAPSVAAALVRGMTDAGANVEDIGLVGTEVLYHTVASRDLDGGIMVTASHNPAHYIGMKCVKRGAQPVGEESGLMDVRDLALAFEANGAPEGPVVGVEAGSVTVVDAVEDWQRLVWSFIDVDKVRPLKVVVDGGNGIGPTLAMPLLERLPIELFAYNAEPDGTFPNHEPNPLLEENREFIVAKVREHGADIGIAFDGDADRCFFVDDTGAFVDGDFITAVLAELTLRREPGSTILYDVRASRAVPDTIERLGGTAIASRVGHAFIKARMKQEDAAFAGEISGHYYFRGFHGVDTGVVPALMLLQLVSESGGGLSDLVADIRSRYFISGEINSTVTDVPMRLQQLKEAYADARITHVDGVSVDYDDWHFNVRPSNTEPLLRLNLESVVSREDMERRRDEVLALIRSDSGDRIGHVGGTAGVRA
ncbi:MAG: phosphomannomutase/phosphoglucomutase [Thermoleophilia bacterium]|nr:phosphomannomutase/phosphoglucomutase [Thermoleophilia bacterium]